MVKIAVAGGTGNVASQVLKVAAEKHAITIFTRSVPRTTSPNFTYKQVNYHDRSSLTTALQGFDVCLSFLVVHLDVDCTAQKNLTHACIDAGVRRFAPSEWGIKNNSGVPLYANKDAIAAYLADLSVQGKLGGMEYCLFQPSIFLDYFAHPYPLSPGLNTWPFFVDFENRRAMVLGHGDYPFALTAIADDAAVLALALGDTRPWPAIGGLRGCRTTINQLVALGKEIRGGEWSIEYVDSADVAKGQLKTSWVPRFSHPTVPEESVGAFSKQFVIMFFQAMARGSWDVSDEWNQRFPGYEFASAEAYLRGAWEGRP